MQKEEILSEIVFLVKTKKDLEALNSELELLRTYLFKEEGKDFDLALKNKVRASLSELLEKRNNEVNLEDLLSSCQKTISKLEEMNLTISFEPSVQAIENIANWVKVYVGGNVYINLEIDKNLIAGCSIAYKGKYLDKTSKNKFDQLFSDKSRINSIISQVSQV